MQWHPHATWRRFRFASLSAPSSTPGGGEGPGGGTDPGNELPPGETFYALATDGSIATSLNGDRARRA